MVYDVQKFFVLVASSSGTGWMTTRLPTSSTVKERRMARKEQVLVLEFLRTSGYVHGVATCVCAQCVGEKGAGGESGYNPARELCIRDNGYHVVQQLMDKQVGTYFNPFPP